jgi:hypothetical protein
VPRGRYRDIHIYIHSNHTIICLFNSMLCTLNRALTASLTFQCHMIHHVLWYTIFIRCDYDSATGAKGNTGNTGNTGAKGNTGMWHSQFHVTIYIYTYIPDFTVQH